MAASLRSRLRDLASAFAESVVEAIRGSSLDELQAESAAARAKPRRPAGHRRAGRLARRSPDDIGAVIDRIVGLLRSHAGGLRAEQIRAELSLDSKELPRPLREGLEAGRFRKSGQKRATTYSLKEGKSVGPARSGGGGSRRKGGGAKRKASPKKDPMKDPKKEAANPEPAPQPG